MRSPNDNQKCPKQEETDNADFSTSNVRRPQRCQQTQSLTQFRSRFVISPTQVPSDVQNHFRNALRTSGTVWERPSRPTPDLLSRLQPWQPGATVKKPLTPSTPSKEVRQVIPLRESLERLKKLRNEIGAQMMKEMRIKEESEIPSIDMNKPQQSYVPMQWATSFPDKEKMPNNGKTDSGNDNMLDGLLEYLEINSEKTSTPVHPPSPKTIPSSSHLSGPRPSTLFPQELPSYSQAIQYYQSQIPQHSPFQGLPTMPRQDRILPPAERHWEPNMPGDEARRDQWRRVHRHDAYREKRCRERRELSNPKNFAKRFEVKEWGKENEPWEDLAKEDTERIEAWRREVACNWSYIEKTVGWSDFGHLGNCFTHNAPGDENIPWVTERDLHKYCPFEYQPSLTSYENTLHPTRQTARYKNWIRQVCSRGGYCYLLLFKRKYRPYAFFLYGKNPVLGDLNLDKEYRSEAFKELNIAIHYEKKLIHVYRGKGVTYEEGFEQYKGPTKTNEELIGNCWLPHYTVGATRVETRAATRTRRVTEESERETEMPAPTSVTGAGTRTPNRSHTPIDIQTLSHPTGHVEVVPGQSTGELYDSDEQDEYPGESSASR